MKEVKFIYDDDCGFCSWWANFFYNNSDLSIISFSELTKKEIDVLPKHYEKCAHLIIENKVYSCGKAIEQAFLHTKKIKYISPLIMLLRKSKTYNKFREWIYRYIANRRGFFGRYLSKNPPK